MYFKDGSFLSYNYWLRDIYFFTDAKALKNSQAGKNTFMFRFSPIPVVTFLNDNRDRHSVGKGFEPYMWGWNGTDNDLINSGYGYGCKQGQTMHYCTKIIQMNGWKIPKDYPIKF